MASTTSVVEALADRPADRTVTAAPLSGPADLPNAPSAQHRGSIDTHITWRDHIAASGLSAQTVRTYRALGLRLADFLLDHGHHPRHPTPDLVRQWSDTLACSRSLRGQAQAAIKRYGAWCNLDGELLAAAIFRPKPPARPRWRSLPAQTVLDLLAEADRSGRAGTAVLFGLYGALRRSEIAGVRWDKIDLDERTAEVWRPKVADWHDVPLAPALVERLADRWPSPSELEANPHVFAGRWGGHVSPGTVSAWVAKVADGAGHPGVTPHQLRHSCATAVYDATRDLVLAQTLLGHKNPSTTAIYVRPNRAAMRQAVDQLAWAS